LSGSQDVAYLERMNIDVQKELIKEGREDFVLSFVPEKFAELIKDPEMVKAIWNTDQDQLKLVLCGYSLVSSNIEYKEQIKEFLSEDESISLKLINIPKVSVIAGGPLSYLPSPDVTIKNFIYNNLSPNAQSQAIGRNPDLITLCSQSDAHSFINNIR